MNKDNHGKKKKDMAVKKTSKKSSSANNKKAIKGKAVQETKVHIYIYLCTYVI